MFTVSITDSSALDALNRLIAFGESPQPALVSIGQKMLDFTKARFVLSQDPYGNAWAINSDLTLRRALDKGLAGSKRNFKKDGSLSKRGTEYQAAFLGSKKPLIGASLSLSTLFNPTVIGDDLVTLSSPMVYAAMQNYGGTKAEFPNLWGDIPARQFFPDKEGGLPDQLQQDISGVLRIAIQNAMNGS